MADAGAGAYLVALLFAAVGATVAHFVVKGLSPADGWMSLESATSAAPGAFVATPPDLTNPYAPPRAG